jgi:hypothetical protein
MIFLGPVSNSDEAHPLFLVSVGCVVLIVAWVKYVQREGQEDVHLGTVLGITAVCAVLIFIGLWELLH